MKKILLLAIALASSQVMAYDCAKKYCKKMESCEEAKHKLEQCGHKQLDRDGDGVPCENVCSGG